MGFSQNVKRLIDDNALSAIEIKELEDYSGTNIVINGNMSIHRYIVALNKVKLMDKNGEITNHLQGIWQKVIQMMTLGVKPIFVFDGPKSKADYEVSPRDTREVMEKNVADSKKLLTLMGIPFIDAPAEAEAQCAAISKAGIAYATASEEMDSLAFGSPILLRHFIFSLGKKAPIKETHLNVVLEQLNMNMDQFIDVCIMLGCGLGEPIKGIGPVRALELMAQYGTLERVLENLDKTKYPVPDYFDYQNWRKVFKNPEVTDPKKLQFKWGQPDEEGLVKFLAGEKAFGEKRLRSNVTKLRQSLGAVLPNRTEAANPFLEQRRAFSTLKTFSKSYSFTFTPKQIANNPIITFDRIIPQLTLTQPRNPQARQLKPTSTLRMMRLPL